MQLDNAIVVSMKEMGIHMPQNKWEGEKKLPLWCATVIAWPATPRSRLRKIGRPWVVRGCAPSFRPPTSLGPRPRSLCKWMLVEARH